MRTMMLMRRRSQFASPVSWSSPSYSSVRGGRSGSAFGAGAPALPRPPATFRAALVVFFSVFAGVNLLVSATSRRNSNLQSKHNHHRSTASSTANEGSKGGHLRGGGVREAWVTSESQPFNHNGVAQAAKHLIVVAGHSVTVSGHLEDAGIDEKDWFLLSYQQHHGLPQAVLAHIRSGIQLAQDDPSALLIFSGGATRAQTGPDTEGASYYRVADAMDLWNNKKNGGASASSSSNTSTVRARTLSEDYATDSFQNLLFSLCRFREVTGSYPERVTVVSFAFKQRRFAEMHAHALQYPSSRFIYVGVDPPESSGFDPIASAQGELSNAAKPFESDPYGCHSDVLQQKRQERNPFFRTPPYDQTCPELQVLLHHCGPNLIAIDQVPWQHLWDEEIADAVGGGGSGTSNGSTDKAVAGLTATTIATDVGSPDSTEHNAGAKEEN